MPTDVLGVMLGHRQAVTTAQLLARLRRASLIQYQEVALGPLLGLRPVRLWMLTAHGRVFVSRRGRVPQPDTGQLPYGEPERRREPSRQRDVPLLVACYRLLAQVGRGLDRPVRVCAWEHPWIRAVSPERGRRRPVRLPAAAVLQSGEGDAEQLRLLLLPDVGTTPLASYRPTLRALLDMRRAMTHLEEEEEPVLIVGAATSPQLGISRVEAWRSLLQDVATRADDRPLRARVLESTASPRHGHSTGLRPGQLDEVFAMVARHPLLTRRQLAGLFGTSTRRIARLQAELIERGWLRPITSEDVPLGTDAPACDQVQRFGFVELTTAGRLEAARRLLLAASLARRRHGVMASVASRRRFLRHLHHTLGANAFFVDLAVAAVRASNHGGDDALMEWRPAAACAHGRFRPDGYGCYRRGQARFGFFLEYDRATEHSRQYAAKLASYYHYRDTGTYKPDYRTFPILLVVTTSEVAEARFAHQAYLAQQYHGGLPLAVFLTTEGQIQTHREGPLGPIWRGPGPARWVDRRARGGWLPDRSRELPRQRPFRNFGKQAVELQLDQVSRHDRALPARPT